jgi:glycogen(starch) synthase
MTVSRPAILPSAFYPHIGGVEELTRQLAMQQRQVGLATMVLANRFPRDLPPHAELDGVPVTRVPFRVPGPTPRHLLGWAARSQVAKAQTAAALSRHAADLIHVQCVSSNGYYALHAARKLSLPLVVSMQGEISMDAGQAYQRSRWLRAMWRRLVRRADLVTGCSRFVLNEAEDLFGESLSGRAVVIPNGVRSSDFSEPAPEGGDRYIFGIGRMVPQKGFDRLINAFGMIAAEFPDLRLVLAGRGPVLANLQSLAAQSGFARRIEFTGAVDRPTTSRLFRGASAFVLPSRHEPQGIVILEAMAAGCPVTAARVGGVPETVKDGVNGLLFATEDQLAANLRRLLASRELVRQLVEAGHATAQEHEWERITEQYVDVYRLASRTG